MCKKLIYTILLMAVFAVSTHAQPISGVSRGGGSTNTAPEIAPSTLDEGEVSFVDRDHQYKEIPESVIGAQYVMVANNDKRQADYYLEVTIGQDATLYLFLDNRLGNTGGGIGVDPGLAGAVMIWVTDLGFTDTGDDIGIDESADGDIDQYFSIFERSVSAGETIVLGTQNDGEQRNMYGVAALGPRLKAYNPVPSDGATYEDTWVSLGWMPRDLAVSHDLYLSENFDDVNSGAEGTFQGNQAGTALIVGFPGYLYPEGLIPGTTYYWRVDEVNDLDPNSPWKGTVWSFGIPPYTAYNPTPSDGVKFVTPDVELSWMPGFLAKLHTVYFGDNFDDVNNATGGAIQTTITYTPGSLANETVYYWRVDESTSERGSETHKGDVWSFRTLPEIAITDENLLGWWTLDEGMGTTAMDWSGYGHHGTLVGTPQWADGYHSGALEFSASGQYVDCGFDAGQEVTGDFTIAAWVKLAPNNAGHYEGIAGKLTRHGWIDWTGFAIVRDSSNVFRLWVSDGKPLAIGGQASSDLTYTDTGWHHVAGVREGQINALYVDGVKQSETSVTVFVPSEDFFHIGRQYSNMEYGYFRGLIDDVRFYNQALSAEEIAALVQ